MFKISILDIGPSHIYKQIKQAGFDSVMLGWRDDDRREKPDRARNAGLLIENIHAPTRNCDSIWLDNLDGEEYMNRLLSSIEDCKEYSIPTMVVHLNDGFVLSLQSDIGLERLRRIAEKAEHCDINVALENTYSPEYIRMIFDNIPSKKLGFCFDSGHQNCMTPDRDLFEEFGDRLMAMHLNDNFGVCENPTNIPMDSIEWMRLVDLHLLPFDGNIDWNKITQQLRNIEYKGAIALEVYGFKDKYASEEVYFEMAFVRAKKLFDMVNQ